MFQTFNDDDKDLMQDDNLTDDAGLIDIEATDKEDKDDEEDDDDVLGLDEAEKDDDEESFVVEDNMGAFEYSDN